MHIVIIRVKEDGFGLFTTDRSALWDACQSKNPAVDPAEEEFFAEAKRQSRAQKEDAEKEEKASWPETLNSIQMTFNHHLIKTEICNKKTI